jgi:hypothetical protein
MSKDTYTKLAERLDMNITGIPKKDGAPSPAFLEYLELLYTPEEAAVAVFLSVAPNFMSPEDVAEKAGRPAEEIEPVLESLLEKGVVLGVGGQYTLPPVPFVVNYHQVREETTEDSIRGAELYQDFFIRDGFYQFYEGSAMGTPHRRPVPVEQSIASGQQVLSHEEIGPYLDKAAMGAYALVPCPPSPAPVL